MRDGRRPVGGDMSRSPRQFAPPQRKVCLSRGWPITTGSGFPVTVGISYLLRSNQWLEPCYGAAQFAARCQRRSGVQAQRRESGHSGFDPFADVALLKVDPRGLNVYSCASTLR